MEAEGKGLGAFAAANLEPGDRVLAERPLLRFEDSDAGLRRTATRGGRNPAVPQCEVLSLEDSWSLDAKTFRGILETNGIDCELPIGESPKVLCLKLSRFNHSCNPNCDYSWNQQNGRMEVYAQTAITVGEELCIPYIDLREPWELRQQLLRENWRFSCRCEVCACKDSAESDRRRVRLGELSALIYRKRRSRSQLSIAKKLLKLYQEENLYAHSYRLEACKFGYAASLDLEEADAPRFARLGLRCAMRCHGPDHEETQEWLKASSLWS
ncbi:unnamed protein product [Effrenium voratum]|nr:unnamed protein product [Effrenium voratum]